MEVNDVAADQLQSCRLDGPARNRRDLGVRSGRANAWNVWFGLDLVAPTVIAGSDLGFRVESTKDNVPVGKIVVRINGHWVDAQVGSSGIAAASSR